MLEDIYTCTMSLKHCFNVPEDVWNHFPFASHCQPQNVRSVVVCVWNEWTTFMRCVRNFLNTHTHIKISKNSHVNSKKYQERWNVIIVRWFSVEGYGRGDSKFREWIFSVFFCTVMVVLQTSFRALIGRYACIRRSKKLMHWKLKPPTATLNCKKAYRSGH